MRWTLWQYLLAYDEFRLSVAHDSELQGRIEARLRKLTEIGNQAKEPISTYVEDGILECRAKSARHQARLLYCFHPERRIVILLGVLKDQRKLARRDIDEAKRRKAIIQEKRELIRGLSPTN